MARRKSSADKDWQHNRAPTRNSCIVAAFVLLQPFAALAQSPATPDPHDAAVVNSSRLQIDLQLAPGSGRVSGVEAWYTLDEGRTWQQGEVEFNKAPPAIFHAPHEGLHGLYVIVRNGVAASAAPPEPGAKPQIWVFVDHTPPLVQIASVQKDPHFARRRRLTLRYTAYDAHLLAQPITIDYAVGDEKQFRTIVSASPNAGRFDWDVPATLHGRVRLRVLAEDRGGQTASAESPPLDLDSQVADAAPPSGAAASAPAQPTDQRNRSAPSESERALALDETQRPFFRLTAAGADRSDAAAQFAEGRLRQARGEYALAEQRFRDALTRDAARADARVALAAVLYQQGRLAEAEREYRTVLKQDPKHASAMAGLAMALAARSDYSAARDVLTTLSALRPAEPGVWIDLGDMQMLAGDRSAGRSAWLRARTLQAVPKDLREQIERRLLIYPEQSLP